MDAVDLLLQQHQQMERLLARALEVEEPDERKRRFTEIADLLTVHITSEEEVFYPAVKASRTEDILLESLEEHLGIKRVIADLMGVPCEDETFDAKTKVLKEQVEHHVKEEETDLFPKVRKIMDRDTLLALAQEMVRTQEDLLAKGDPRKAVPQETAEAQRL